MSTCKGKGSAKGFGCGNPYVQYNSLDKGLCIECRKEFLKQADTKTVDSAVLNALKQVRVIEKKLHKERKKDLMTKSELEKLLQSLVNQIVRLIDNEKGCISCEHGWDGNFTRQAHAGHRFSIGSNHSLRFNAFNIFKQCSICNNYLSGNELEYTKGIIKRYGQSVLDKLESERLKYQDVKLTNSEINEAIIAAREVKKAIVSGSDFSREMINELVGIYK